jgi:hypothetical protein
MEADWEVEIGGEAPVIDMDWPGLIDLRIAPSRVDQLPEVRLLPVLREILVRLNVPVSHVWTSKCDIWAVEEFDPDELGAQVECRYAIASYLDLLSSDPRRWAAVEDATSWSSDLCRRLHAIELRCCRVDLVARRAFTKSALKSCFGITAYLTACGTTRGAAEERLGFALEVFAAAVAASGTPVCLGS